MAAVVGLEAGLISQRTRAALAAAKAMGIRLGNPRLRSGMPEHARAAAVGKSSRARARVADPAPPGGAAPARTLHELAEALTHHGVPTSTSHGNWRPEQIRQVQTAEARPAPPASMDEGS